MALEQKAPSDLSIEIENADGAEFRLRPDAAKASDVPSSVSYATQRIEGFSTASFTVNRPIFRDYPDLELLNTVRFVWPDGSIAYEGLIQSMPRSNNPQTIQVNCVGCMTSLKWKPISSLIIDRRVSAWTEASLQRRAVRTKESNRYEASPSVGWQGSASGPGVVFSFQTFDATYAELGEAWAYAAGQTIAEIRADFANLIGAGGDTSWGSFLGLSDDDIGTGAASTGVHDVTTPGLVAASATAKYGFMAIGYSNNAVVGTGNNFMGYLHPRLIGNHGLTSHGTSPEDGFYLSDIIHYIVEKFGKNLVWEGEENQFLIQQATWHDSPTTPYEAITQLNNYALYEFNAWEGGRVVFEPADLTKADWQIRTSDPGVTVNFQGDSIESFANGVVVTFSDFFGHTFTLSPDQYVELRSEDENNAASRHAEEIWISYTIPWQCLEGEALQFGRAYLAQNNRVKRPGSFTVSGYIRDAAGHLRRAGEVRSSETISIMDDLYEGEPRLIYATSTDDSSQQTTITVDAPPRTIEAWVARQQLALESAGLS